MNTDEYLAAVRAQLPYLPSEEVEGINQCIVQLFRSGFTVRDAAAYCRCMEEVNPKLDENIALQRMSHIRLKYNDTERP